MKVYIDNVEYELNSIQIAEIKKQVVDIVCRHPPLKLAKCISDKSFALHELLEERDKIPCEEYKFDVKVELEPFSLIGCFPVESDKGHFKLSIDYIT